jgi:hypothetical protein
LACSHRHSENSIQGNFGIKADLSSLKLFGAWVCVKRTSVCHGKLDHHDFTGIFLSYSNSNQNIQYLDLNSGVVKTCHHAQFDKAWYLQHECHPGPQLLYDLGLEVEDTFFLETGPAPEYL